MQRPPCNYFRSASNRTKVELKFDQSEFEKQKGESSNRTKVELKYGIVKPVFKC